MHKLSIDMEALDRHLAKGYLDNLGKGAKATVKNRSMEEIRNKIKVGETYTITRITYGDVLPETGNYKILYKDRVKFLGQMECGVKECFLFQSVLCRDIRVIDRQGNRIKEDTKQIQPVAISLYGERQKWRPSDDSYIRNNLDKSTSELARKLNRSEASIRTRRAELRNKEE